jgi:hypothetical protein
LLLPGKHALIAGFSISSFSFSDSFFCTEDFVAIHYTIHGLPTGEHELLLAVINGETVVMR